ncbi:heme oxygenase-like protein [Pyrenochaeta sp. DS3sAY3a]|nr:heme oxygenase-like protein [Pyrenochaeta sp. DS3sAY3a]
MLEKQLPVAREEVEEKDAARLPVSLSGEINTATRTHHTTLNRLITSRLPLALPPHAADSSLYTTGLLHFAYIYLTFESLWADILRTHPLPTSQSPSTTSPYNDDTEPQSPTGDLSPPTSPLLSYLLVNPYDAPSLFTSTLGAPTPPSPQLTTFLHTLRPKGLPRSTRLKRDLEYLLGLHATDLEVLLATYPGDAVAQFCTHIRKSVNEKPWTLVSYAWCFYMAIFSGGRWIRAGLTKVPSEFWPASAPDTQSPDLSTHGLSFWHFPGAHDGEDIKSAFKAHLSAHEHIFTAAQRIDIIEEAKSIFTLAAALVHELDAQIGTDLGALKGARVHGSGAEKEGEKDGARLSEGVVDEKTTLLIVTDVPDGVTGNGKQDANTLSLSSVLRRPEIAGTLVALGCLACVALVRMQ